MEEKTKPCFVSALETRSIRSSALPSEEHVPNILFFCPFVLHADERGQYYTIEPYLILLSKTDEESVMSF